MAAPGAIGAFYDADPATYAAYLPDLRAEAPVDRAMLAAFAHHVGAGVLAWYSLSHTDPADLVAALAEMGRVLRPGGFVPVGSVALFEMFHAGYDLTTIDVDMVTIVEVDNVVGTERVDHIIDSAGKRIISLPCAGLIVFDHDNKVAHWTDYWDMREFDKLPTKAGR